MIEMLQKPVILAVLALSYGVELATIGEMAEGASEDSEKRAAESELETLKYIQKYPQTQRGNIRCAGGSFVAPLGRIPRRLLSIEKRRVGALLSSNHKRAHKYTDYAKGQVYRRPAPGCGGQP